MVLANFSRVLEAKRAKVGYHQVWRWLKADKMPKVITWLAGDPELAEALAEDARAMSAAGGIVGRRDAA
jgi:hypothetical protein